MRVKNKILVTGLILSGLCFLSLWLSLTAKAQAAFPQQQTNHCVRTDGMGGCYTTIQAAVNASLDGDTITIAGGTYTESVAITRSLTISGGWQPAGWPLTETVVQANSADCAISIDNVSGSLNNLTATGANTAGICGIELLTYTMANVTARNNMGHGTAVEVSRTLTISSSSFNNNQQNGLVTGCTYSNGIRDTTVTIADSTARGNIMDGFNGGYSGANCNFYLSYHRVNAVDNGKGFNDFGGVCPAFNETVMSVEISASTIISNGTGIMAGCGSDLLLQQNVVRHNGVGLRSDEAGFNSINNLYTDNQFNGLVIRAGYWESTNDTITNNGIGELVLYDDVYPVFLSNKVESGCDTPTVKLTNTIIWDSATSQGLEWYGDPSCMPYIPGPFMVEINHSLISGREFLVDIPNIIYFTLDSAVYDANPFFAGNGSYQLLPPSPAIDRGTADNAPLIDINGNPRPQDGDGDAIPDFDMGAYEAPPGLIHRSFTPIIARA